MRTLSILLTDLRHTLRQLGRAKTFALTAILTLALGVGANVVVFGVLDAMLLRPLPDVPQPQQLSFIEHRDHSILAFSFPQYRDLRRRNHAFTDIGAYDLIPVGLVVKTQAVQRWAYAATGSYFHVLGTKPYLGRFFTAADDAHGPNGSPWAVLAYHTWKDDFAGDPGIVGRSVLLSKHPFTVLGVAPQGFYGTERFVRPALWVDLWNEEQLVGYNSLHDRSTGNIWMIGRRKPGVSVAQAQAELNRVAPQMARQYPQTDEAMQLQLATPGYVGTFVGGPLRAFLSGLMLLASLVLAAACANLGGLYSAHASDRTREIAIRVALGSSRSRIAISLLLESIVVAIIGGALGCVLARVALHMLTNYLPPFNFPTQVAVNPTPIVYVFAVVVSLAAGLLCALIPMRETNRADPNQLIKSAGGGGFAEGRRWALRDALLLIEVVLCCVLVTASFVSLRGLALSQHLPLGFQPDRVTRIAYNPSVAGYTNQQALLLDRHILDEAAALPGADHAALASGTPLDMVNHWAMDVFRQSVTDFRAGNILFNARTFSISPGYFSTAGTRLLAGRPFSWADNTKAPQVAIVNETFARRLFGDRSALGESFISGADHHKFRIVGVVEDGKYTTLNESSAPALFLPIAQWVPPFLHLLVRAKHPAIGEQASLDRALIGILHRADANVPITYVGSWNAALAPVLFPTRAATIALGILGTLALLLAVTGIFGLASYTVSRRMREFGIRVAVGAPRRAILRTALGRIGRILIVGSVGGILLGLASSRVLAAVVYGASAFDPVVLLAVCCTMLLVGLLSVALPARRAMRVEPAILLREE